MLAGNNVVRQNVERADGWPGTGGSFATDETIIRYSTMARSGRNESSATSTTSVTVVRRLAPVFSPLLFAFAVAQLAFASPPFGLLLRTGAALRFHRGWEAGD